VGACERRVGEFIVPVNMNNGLPLEQKPTSWIELSEKALRKNIHYLKRRIGSKSRFCSVIKGNAYGHGIMPFVEIAERAGIDIFAVFDAYEAEQALQAARDTTDIMVMGMMDHSAVTWAVEKGISFYVFDADRMETAIRSAKACGRPARIHLELETGLNRTGLEGEELSKVCNLVKQNADQVELMGVCTHYAGAESIANYTRISQQMERYKLLVEMLASWKLIPAIKHVACSAAALSIPESILDMVRFGIAQYGFWPSKETRMHNLLAVETSFKKNPLQRVISWKSRVMGLKKVSAGKFVSYGTSYLTARDETLAVIPVGYAHGFSRSLSNRGHMLIHGKRAPVVGMVNMNMAMVDVTDIPGVGPGDEVVMIGKQGRHEISVSAFTDLTQNVNYETLTRLPSEIPRVIVD